MSDANFNASEHSGTKPRLSLLSSKQGMRLKSEDQPDQIGISARDDYANVVIKNPVEKEHHAQGDLDSHSINLDEESQRLNGNSRNEENKMNITKEDLIRLLSMLKSELQSKEIALAAIKCEQLKRLINPVEISRSSLANTYIELQDRFKARDQNNNTKRSAEQSSSASIDNQRNGQTEMLNREAKDQDYDDNNRESLNILNTLLELLDRHPLLALPRDSIYCLDYNCNELSTKNYLNLKIQHLDNLINQHRRYRYYMNEHVKRAERRFHELAGELEIERSLKYDSEKAVFKATGRTILLKHIDQLKESLEKEKKDKQTIVMTLLNELLDERERTESLARKLADQESISANSIQNTSGKEERLIRQEAELNDLRAQLKKQSVVLIKERDEFQSKIQNLEMENAGLKTKLDQQGKHILALTKSSSTSSESKDSNQTGQSPVLSKANNGAKQAAVGKQTSNPGTPAVVTRSSLASSATKSSPPPRTTPPISNSTNSASSRVLANNAISNSSPQAASTASKTTAGSSANQKPSAPPVVSRILNNSNAEQASIRIQPLFKSASVQSTNQQVRNLKGAANNGGHTAPLTRASSSSSNPPVTKPQVPAKPAQLLDQQRNSLN